ncbi:MAG: NnrU family protein [Alphaproteobacteria bacterium]|nr:NnrU family protein [Alphaproteobacteria bacterium]
MTLLVLGIFLWMGAHLYKRVLPVHRVALMENWGTKRFKIVITLAIVISLICMIIGYRQTEITYLYALPIWAWHLNNAMMLVALFLMEIGRVRGVLRSKIRHPMLTAVLIWASAHLLVNGDLSSVILFGGIGLWAVIEIALINRMDGPWQRPEPGSWFNDAKVLAIAAIVYVVVVGIHYGLDHPVIAALW